MTKHTVWAIYERDVTWQGGSPFVDNGTIPRALTNATSFTIADKNLLVQLTFEDDDDILNNFASGTDFISQKLWNPPKPINGQEYTPGLIESTNYKTFSAVPGAGMLRVGAAASRDGQAYIVFTNVKISQIEAGVSYNLYDVPVPDGFGNYSDERRGLAPTIRYDEITPVCFSTGVRISTDRGDVPVDSLLAGDMVQTMDNGFQPIRWIGRSECSSAALRRIPELRPVVIPQGSLGNDLPHRDLIVSRQHRILAKSAIAHDMFGSDEVFVPAVKLIGLNGVRLSDRCENVTYYHLLFDNHEVIFANGAPAESLFTGPMALKRISPDARKEIEILFPDIADPIFSPLPARYIPKKGKDIRTMISQHLAMDINVLRTARGT